MTAPARLLALRLHGFKSFAERTVVEFGPGISAVVGPNGSGKSNLADALRWTLGEQGRALRLRRSEDVIWAGSERRAAVGMADVTLVLDNSDGLLPVDYSVLELGRRLYRSGENDYLLNRQRVRLRDLVDLLDAAHLADNAFLFIGQGMVDQALALRPEERRPLFEEVAGVRRHERRRRKAEEQLTESEANLARVTDILAELRPQARRLAAQAEQQSTRATAGTELADGLVLAAHARWHEAARRAGDTAGRRSVAAAAVDRAMADLHAAEQTAAAIAAGLGGRAELERERVAAHDASRAALTALQLREARLHADRDAVERDRGRAAEERAAAEADLALQRRRLALPIAEPDREADAELREAERALADALAELAEARAAGRAREGELAAVRRAESARQAEGEAARRRLAEAERRAGEQEATLRDARERAGAAEEAVTAATRSLRTAGADETAAAARREASRLALEDRERERRASAEAASTAGAHLAEIVGRLRALEAHLRDDEGRGIARAATRRGGRRVDEDLVVDAELRGAVGAALGEEARAYVVEREAVAALAGERGILVVDGTNGAKDGAVERAFVQHVVALGGGRLVDAIRRDPGGAAGRLLARTAWLPDLASCLLVQHAIPAGWLIVTRDGKAAVTGLTVRLGAGDAVLERRADLARLTAEAARTDAERGTADEAARTADAAAEAARGDLETAKAAESTAAAARRRAEESERLAVRAREAAARELQWHEAQSARLTTELDRARAAATAAGTATASGTSEAGQATAGATDASAAWEARVAELRARRDRLAAEHAARETARRAAEARRATAEAAIVIDEKRIAGADAESASLAHRAEALAGDAEAIRGQVATAVEAEARQRALLDELRAADSADRERLSTAERTAAAARDRLRAADESLRAADHAELEARLGLDGLREQLLVELAGLGDLGRRRLLGEGAGDAPGTTAGEPEDEAAALEAALDHVAPSWTTAPPTAEPPSPARLASLRRRYHELGAANPFAVEEYAEIRTRLEGLETQEGDLRSAIAQTRDLIADLNRMIADQFTTTFRALEAAFDRRFGQLFGGGYARLQLTDPEDLATTGIEILARPPGKKAQPLAMLSGGERALTAVALLFAMLEVRPVPFCVLDEVDAALDEANVGRFSDALRGLAERTQFVVITHNRGTIEAADALYGVTAGDDSVSRVISLRLEEARAIAERRREARPAATVG